MDAFNQPEETNVVSINDATRKKSFKSTDEMVELFKQYQAGSKSAKDKLTTGNIGLVKSRARKYTADPFLFDDLVQEGITGLIRAIEKFKPELGFQFSTYADRWIRNKMEHYLSTTYYNVKVPTDTRKMATKIFRMVDELRLGKESEAIIIKKIAERNGLSEHVVGRLIELRNANARMQDRFEYGDGGVAELQDTIESEDDICANLETSQMLDWARDMIEKLPEKQCLVLKSAYGLDDGEEKSFASIAKTMGCSREYVRQIRNKGMESLKEQYALSQNGAAEQA